jgi:hypothetical protein
MRKKKKIRFFMAMTAAVLLLPGFTAYVLYEMQSPYTYVSEQELSPVASSSEDGSIYEQNLTALQAFQEDNWDTLSTQERVNLLQWLADFEAEKLGFDPVSLTAERINLYTLGDYDNDTNTIRIDVKQVAQSSAADCMEVICHEVWHAYEYYIVDQLDWSSPVVQTAYFDEIRTWKYNIENYQSGWYSYEAYIEQGLEDSAFSYAEEETGEIMSYVGA